MKYSILIMFLFIEVSMSLYGKQPNKNTIRKNGVTVSWKFSGDRVYFEMSAPTDGWVTIGFNTTSSIKNAYLLMGNVVNEKPSVIEHFTINSGNYSPVKDMGVEESVSSVEGYESEENTVIKFSLPVKATNIYARNLDKGKEYVMILAYSQSDDFQHHSIMRTSAKIKL